MAFLRFWLVVLLVFCAEFLLPALFPWARNLLDPPLLLLVFLGFTLPSGRFLWARGLLLGGLRDLAGGGLFGGFAVSFALAGFLLETMRRFLEREDPLIQAVGAGVLIGCVLLLYGVVVTLADPAVGWTGGWWALLPLSMAAQGALAFWGFPRLKKFLCGF
ncbi:MAG: hypothetical protein HYZ90_03930 [Candidatus Omnitrophica bacterium]|nr:hypothetical protein [Candidatus Omnitrophota bacterium]